VHRPQNDPFIHDDTIPSMVLHQVAAPNAHKSGKSKTLGDLERELDLHPEQGEIRDNEGEAASYGIYFDDTEYDYMQHLRDLGEAGGEVGFADAMPVKYKGKGKAKVMKLEDALRESTLEDVKSEYDGIAGSEAGTISSSRLGDDFLPPQNLRKTTYQDQQDVPDVLAGFQPDMDPRLREALEALDDDSYVDDAAEEDIFGSLVEGGKVQELSLQEFEEMAEFEDEDGWESDETEKAQAHRTLPPLTPGSFSGEGLSSEAIQDEQSTIPAAAEDGAWLAEFSKFKRATQAPSKPTKAVPAVPSSLNTSSTSIKPVKKRKGALTSSSSYSMTSSSLVRTDGLRLLDDRFDRMDALYSLDEDGEDMADDEDGGVSVAPSVSSRLSKVSRASAASSIAPSLIEAKTSGALRSDFDNMMDDFLSGFPDTKSGKSKAASTGVTKKERREGRYKNGMKMLDQLRVELGPARVHP
jgi:protein LTV1